MANEEYKIWVPVIVVFTTAMVFGWTWVWGRVVAPIMAALSSLPK